MTRTVEPPTTRKNRNSPIVANEPRLARKLMPFSTPDVAETRKSAGDHDDDEHGHGVRLGYVEEVVEPAVELQAVEPERGGRAEEGGHDRERVDEPADRAARRRSGRGSGVKRRADQDGQVLAEAEVGHRAAHDGVHRPAVEAPVEVGVAQRDQRGLLAPRLGQAVRRGGPVRDRLGDAVEEQARRRGRRRTSSRPRRTCRTRAASRRGRAGSGPTGEIDQEDAQHQRRRRRSG